MDSEGGLMIPQDAFIARTHSIDLGALRAFVGDDDDIVMRFLDRFRTGLRLDVAEMQFNVAGLRWTDIASLSQKMQRSALALGARRLSILCHKMEKAVLAQDEAGTQATWAELALCVADVVLDADVLLRGQAQGE